MTAKESDESSRTEYLVACSDESARRAIVAVIGDVDGAVVLDEIGRVSILAETTDERAGHLRDAMSVTSVRENEEVELLEQDHA